MDPSQPLNAAEALNAGAIDVLPWPFEERDILSVFTAARDRRAVDVDSSSDADDTLHLHSPAMRTVADAVRAATSRKIGLLLVGAPVPAVRLWREPAIFWTMSMCTVRL